MNGYKLQHCFAGIVCIKHIYSCCVLTTWIRYWNLRALSSLSHSQCCVRQSVLRLFLKIFPLLCSDDSIASSSTLKAWAPCKTCNYVSRVMRATSARCWRWCGVRVGAGAADWSRLRLSSVPPNTTIEHNCLHQHERLVITLWQVKTHHKLTQKTYQSQSRSKQFINLVMISERLLTA